MAARSAAKIRGFTPPKGVFAMNLGRQTPQLIAGIHPAQWPCNVPRHATACVHSLSSIDIISMPRPQRPRACERENSATGHIEFLDFINAAAFPFARNPCNMLGSPAFILSITHWIGSMRVPGTTQPTLPIHPASSTSPRAGKASLRSEPSKRAIEAGRAGGTPASTTRAGHLACAWLARAHAQPRLDYGRIKRT